MPTFRQLDLFPDLPGPGRPDLTVEPLKRRGAVEYRELAVREILNRQPNRRLPFAWTINPYRGCEFACTYCYARYTHAFLDLERWEDFERRIFVKRGAGHALLRRLRSASLANQPIAIGTATDPYQPAELRYGVTRSLLEACERAAGLELSITTKSPLILRDLDLLRRLATQHRLTVHVTITTLDSRLARRLEPHAPDPVARLDTVRRVAAAGIPTLVFCMPLMPGINDGAESLDPLFDAVVSAGAHDVAGSCLFLRSAARERFLSWLEQEMPALVPLYERLYGGRQYLRRSDKDAVMAAFRRLRARHGFPRSSDSDSDSAREAST